MAAYNDQLKQEYNQLFVTCNISPLHQKEVNECIHKISANKPRYETVSARTGVPWTFIGIIHSLECSCNFNGHLHNGDPLTARTVHEPKNCPHTGTPPFTWEFSAEDALKQRGLDRWTDWSIAGMLYQFEGYNGFGYRRYGIASPYLWSFSNHYTKGKFKSDGVFDPAAVSKQPGAAVLLLGLQQAVFNPQVSE